MPHPDKKRPPEDYSVDFLVKAVTGKIDQAFLDSARKCGEQLANPQDRREKEKLSTHQVRNVFGAVQKLKLRNSTSSSLSDDDIAQFQLLQAFLSYAAGKADTWPVYLLVDILIPAIKAVGDRNDDPKTKERFDRFCQGFEAILAYHRACGGK